MRDLPRVKGHREGDLTPDTPLHSFSSPITHPGSNKHSYYRAFRTESGIEKMLPIHVGHCLHISPTGNNHYYPHFIEGETKAQNGWVTCPRSHKR